MGSPGLPKFVAIATLSMVTIGCGGGGKNDGSGGAAATGGSGGEAGGATGGTAGATGGTAGTGGMGGSGGIGGSMGGSAGAGGGVGGSPGGAGGQAGSAGAGQGFPPYPDVPFPPENEFTPEKALLGKVLFWEEQVGSDDTMACGTCHRPSAGGSDPRPANPAAPKHPGVDDTLGTADDIHGAAGVARCQDNAGTITRINDPVFGMGIQVTKRRAPSYLDAMFFDEIFWDGRARSAFVVPDTMELAIVAGGALESQAVGPPVNSAEMACDNRTWADIHAKLQSVTPLALARDIPPAMETFIAGKTYADLFNEVFGSPEINTKRFAFAVATHERTLTSDQTPWDLWNAGDSNALTPDQVQGFLLMEDSDKGNCRVCHRPPEFTDRTFHNLGFHAPWVGDEGRAEASMQAFDVNKFKTPGLRNVGLREAAGLLHDGIGNGADMVAVMDAYVDPPNLSPDVSADVKQLDLTQEEVDQIIDFMRNGLTDPRARDELPPFDRPKLSTEP